MGENTSTSQFWESLLLGHPKTGKLQFLSLWVEKPKALLGASGWLVE